MTVKNQYRASITACQHFFSIYFTRCVEPCPPVCSLCFPVSLCALWCPCVPSGVPVCPLVSLDAASVLPVCPLVSLDAASVLPVCNVLKVSLCVCAVCHLVSSGVPVCGHPYIIRNTHVRRRHTVTFSVNLCVLPVRTLCHPVHLECKCKHKGYGGTEGYTGGCGWGH